MIFSRKIDDDLASLVKKIDAAVAENKDKNMRSFVVFLGDDREALKPAVEEFAKANRIKQVPLTVAVEQPSGPENYGLNDEAAYTILLYKNPVAGGVIVNHALGEKDLNKKTVRKIVKDTKKILD